MATLQHAQGTLANVWLQICLKLCQKAFDEKKVQISDPFISHCPAQLNTCFCKSLLLGANPVHRHLKEVKRRFWVALVPGEKAVDEKTISCRQGTTCAHEFAMNKDVERKKIQDCCKIFFMKPIVDVLLADTRLRRHTLNRHQPANSTGLKPIVQALKTF